MVEVVIFAEGQTEEQFIKQVVAPALRHLEIHLKPQLLPTSRNARGGAISFDRLKFNARNTLRLHNKPVLSTFLDLYALDTDFPAFDLAKSKPTVYERVACLEEALHQAVTKEAGCRPEHFVPHIQPFEFEGLLFSDISKLCEIEPGWQSAQKELNRIRSSFDSPEHINGSYNTRPSKCLEGTLRPQYRKTRHGPLAAERITLDVMQGECAHFRSWMDKLKALASNMGDAGMGDAGN